MNDQFESNKENKECSAIGYQTVDVCVPVILGARAEVGEAFVDCGRKCPYDKPEDFTPEEIEKTPDEEDEIQ